MKSRYRTRISLLALGGAVFAAAVVAAAFAANGGNARSAADHKCPIATGSGDAAFVKNFNPFNVGASRDFTWGGIYENLVISTAFGGGHIYNVLAKSVAFSKDGKTLNITIVPNAKWSNGKPVTAEDVQYSLAIGKQDKAADHISYSAPNTNVQSIKVTGPYSVAIKFKAVDSTFIGSQLGNVPIVPKAIWSKVKDIMNFTNPNPVGSGPFNRITRFNGQDYVLGKNPNYHMAGLPRIQCIERIAAASNDAALLQIVNGEADWTHNFVPNVESAYQAKDPAHYHNAYLTTGLPIALYFDLTKYPYNIVGFRKGVSLAINRKDVSKLGEYGYAPPTSALGLEQMYPKWIDPSLKAKAKAMAAYDPAAAKTTFQAAGFTYKGSKLYDPKGDPVSFDIHVIGGWSDWVASLQIITRNLQAVGIDSNVKLEPDWGAWQPNAMSTKFTTLLWNYGNQDITPYAYFYAHYDPSQNLGAGVDASPTGNWEHYSNAQGAALLKQFKATLDPAKQKQIAYKLQALFLDELPFVPLFIGPRWSTYSTKYFKGWVTWQNQYVDPIFNTQQQVEKILLSLYPAAAT
jgi:peptide/nickel transport system substrate-binding protein